MYILQKFYKNFIDIKDVAVKIALIEIADVESYALYRSHKDHI